MFRKLIARSATLAFALASGGCESEQTSSSSDTPGVTGASGGAAPPNPGIPVDVAGAGAPIPVPGTGAMIMPTPPAAMPVMPAPMGKPDVPPVASGKVLPCDVSAAIAKNCGTCHGAMPVGGAPMPLVSYDDFMQPAKSMPAMKVHEQVKLRIHDKAKPMPPGGTMPAADMAALDGWLSAGMKPGNATDKCEAPAPSVPLTFEPLVPLPGETCYEFPVHNGQSATDTTPYRVPLGEHYVQFYYDAPWPSGSLGTRYGAKYDNKKVIHHWLMFSSDELDPAGSYKVAPLPTLLGVNAQLIAGWAVGGANMVMPEGVGFELPPRGNKIDIQWHYYNQDSAPTTDISSVQVCTVPANARKHVASITWVGTEDLNGNVWFGGRGMPARQTSTFQGTCNPLRTGMNATDPIKIIGFWPHMHQLGTNMKAVINRANGTKETVFDKPFDFNYQIHYMQSHDLNPGDTLTAICTFNNTTDRGVPFGESSDTEMCYNFVMSYPAHALDNGVVSLIGATNTCW